MPKKIKTQKSSAENSRFLSKLFLSIGIALFFLSVGIYLGRQLQMGKLTEQNSQTKKILFIEDIQNGSMVAIAGRENTYDLSVKNSHDSVFYFSTLPDEFGGKITVDQYLSVWNTYFSKYNPNATLVIYDENGTQHMLLGQLKTAVRHKEKNRIDYTFHLFDTEELKTVTSQKVEQKQVDKFGTAALFIDSYPNSDFSGTSIMKDIPYKQ
jgi:hypothetical protein